MPTNTKSKAEKAAIKRRQRARKKAEEMAEVEKQRATDLLGEMEKVAKKNGDAKVAAVARRAKKNFGAPLKLTPTIAALITRYMLEGNYLSTACKCAGVHHITFRKWMKQAEEAMKTAEAAHETAEAEMDLNLARLRDEIQRTEARIAEADEDAEAEEILEKLIEVENTLKSSRDELELFSFVPEDRRIHVHLHMAIEMAEGEAERSLLKKAAKGDRGWQGAMAVMEKRYRGGWGKQVDHNHKVTGDSEKPVVFALESDQERSLRVAKILANAQAIPSSAQLEEHLEQDVIESSSHREVSAAG